QTLDPARPRTRPPTRRPCDPHASPPVWHAPTTNASPADAPIASPRVNADDWSSRRLHFVGIGGAGMSGLALIAGALGAQVTGSDRAESSYTARLRERGIEPAIGHAAEN